MNASELCEALRDSLPALFECALAPDGAVRVRTPFMYPDGDIIDLFVEERGAEFLLTDYGEALGWLRLQSFSDSLTAGRQRLIEDACRTLGIELDRGQLTHRCEDSATLADAVQRLGQASVRVSDIWFTFRAAGASSISDDVNEWLLQRSFDFERNVHRTGRSGRRWTMDYRIVADDRTSLVFILSTGTQAWARRMSERVFAACSDLSHHVAHERDTAFVSLFDDSTGVWRDEDLALVEGVSRVATWSQRDEFERILTTEWARPAAMFTPQ